MSEIKTITFPGDTEPREIVDASARQRLEALEKGGTAPETVLDLTLEEAVVSTTLELGKAYKYLEVYVYVPKTASNTTNNNGIKFYANQGNLSTTAGAISLYGVLGGCVEFSCFPEGYIAKGYNGQSAVHEFKNSASYSAGISSFFVIPNTSSESDMIPAGTHILIRGQAV